MNNSVNFKDGDVVIYNGQQYVYRIYRNPLTGVEMPMLYTLDGQLAFMNFSLQDITLLSNFIGPMPSGGSGGGSSSSGGGGGGGSSSSRNLTKDLENSTALSNNIGTLFQTEKSLSDCVDIINEAKNAVQTNNLTINTWNDVNNAQGLATDASIAFLSGLTDSFDSLSKNLDATKGALTALNELNKKLKALLVKYTEKKEEENNLKAKEAELASTPKEIDDGVDEKGNTKRKPNPRIAELEKEIGEIKDKIAKLEKDIESMREYIDAEYVSIKKKHSELKNLGSMENGINIEINSTIFGTEVSDSALPIPLSTATGNVVLSKYRGRNFYVVNTEVGLDDYVEYLKDNGLYQNKGFLGGRCDVLAMVYARDMAGGTFTAPDSFANSGVHVTMSSVVSHDVDDIKKCVYEEVSKGNPVALQVTAASGYRHFVTVVGFDESVKSYEDLDPNNLLVLDCVDGDVQLLSDRNRDYYSTGNTAKTGYQAKCVA